VIASSTTTLLPLPPGRSLSAVSVVSLPCCLTTRRALPSAVLRYERHSSSYPPFSKKSPLYYFTLSLPLLLMLFLPDNAALPSRHLPLLCRYSLPDRLASSSRPSIADSLRSVFLRSRSVSINSFHFECLRQLLPWLGPSRLFFPHLLFASVMECILPADHFSEVGREDRLSPFPPSLPLHYTDLSVLSVTA